MSTTAAPRCPTCDGELVPLVWGMPDLELFEAAERGEAAIGGCIVPDGPWPQWHCKRCDRDVHLTDDQARA